MGSKVFTLIESLNTLAKSTERSLLIVIATLNLTLPSLYALLFTYSFSLSELDPSRKKHGSQENVRTRVQAP